MRTKKLVALSVAVASGVIIAVGQAARASTVTLPYTFTPGTAAQASQVNANFTAVKTANDDNNSRIVTLEAKKGIIASSYVAASAALPSLANTWQFISPTISVTVAAGQPVEIQAQRSLGPGSTTSSINVDICYSVGTGAAMVINGSSDWQKVTITAGNQQLLHSFALKTNFASGTYNVGLCGSTSTPANFTLSDWGRVLVKIFG